MEGHGNVLGRDLLKGVKKVHIVGVGGISMSAIAKILVHRGFECTGSDKTFNDQCADVEAIGVHVFSGHEASNISDQGLVIYTAAVSEEIPEIVRAGELGIPVVGRAAFLGKLMEEYEHSIAISGVHGKTTTTSMVSHILMDLADPTVLVGGLLHDNHSNVVIGQSDTFVHEACEFKDTFLSLSPRTSVILNVDADHLDYFSGIDAIIASFRRFAFQTRDLVVYNADDEYTRKAVEGLPRRYVKPGVTGTVHPSESFFGGDSGEAGASRLPGVVSFGLHEEADYRVIDLQSTPEAGAKFQIEKEGEILADIRLEVEGFINWVNAAAAFAVCYEVLTADAARQNSENPNSLSRPEKEIARRIAQRLEDFRNADRRFQRYGTFRGIEIVDDFAHHPSEIKHAIETARAVSHGKVIALFQPYTYSRTKALLQEFGECFAGVDELVVSDILGGRESDPGDIHSRDVVNICRKLGVRAHLSDTLEHAGDLSISLAEKGDMILTLGCGNVYLAARYMKKVLS